MFSNIYKSLTQAQETADNLFLDPLRQEFINPLQTELEGLITGYSTMNFTDRYANVVLLNEPFYNKGDSLELHETPSGLGMLVYAGVRLGEDHKHNFIHAGIEISQYRPRFSNDYMSGVRPNETRLIPGSNEVIEESTIKVFLQYEKDVYNALPISFRAALLVQHVCENMVVLPSDATRLVLGAEIESPSQRWIAKPTRNAQNLGSGWLIRARDNKPSNELMLHIGSELRSSTNEFVKANGTNSIENQINKRATKSVPDAVYSYIDSKYRANHVYIGDKNKGNCASWLDVLMDVMDNVKGCHDYSGEPNNLKRGYENNRGKYPFTYKTKRQYEQAQAKGVNHG